MRFGHFTSAVFGFVSCAVLAGCYSIDARIDRAASAEEVLRGTVRFYTDDYGDETCVAAMWTPSTGSVFSDPLRAHDIYRIGSLTKLMLAPLVLRLHDEHVIDLDAPVPPQCMMDLPPEFAGVTPRDLMESKSGLPREFHPPNAFLYFLFTAVPCGAHGIDLYGDYQTKKAFLRELRRDSSREAVRRREPCYSNMGFGLLGMVLDDRLGRPLVDVYDAEARRKSLHDTAFTLNDEQKQRLTRCVAGQLPWFVPRRTEVPEHPLGEALRATGALKSSASDMLRSFSGLWPYVDSFAADSGLASLDDDACVGLFRVKRLKDGRTVLYRHGMTYGGGSFVCFDPASRMIVLILRNATDWPDGHAFAVVEKLLGILPGSDRAFASNL